MAPNKFGDPLRQRIVDDFNSGISQKNISKKNISVSRIISRYLKTKEVSVVHRGGRPRKTSLRTDAMLIRKVKKEPFISASKLVQEFQLNVSTRTVSRRLAAADLSCYRPSKKPLISFRNQKKRMQFAKEHLSWDKQKWSRVLFSDESKFNIMGSDGISYVRRPRGKRFESRYCIKTLKHGGGSVMVWGCFSAAGLGPLHRINGIMDQYVYKNILMDVMLPYAEWEMPLRWVFQQDNDPKHTSRLVKTWLNDHNITVMNWPPQSPDLNPIENLWEIVKRKINRENVKNADDFFKRVQTAWNEVPPNIIQNLIESMPRRCKAVVKNKGFATKY